MPLHVGLRPMTCKRWLKGRKLRRDALRTLLLHSMHNFAARAWSHKSGGIAQNALPESARATLNCQILEGDSVEAIQRSLWAAVNDSQVTITLSNKPKASLASPIRPDILRAAEVATQTIWPDVPVIPSMITGGTDGAWLRVVGVPTYGVTALFSEGDTGVHGRNEHIGVRRFYEALGFHYTRQGFNSTAISNAVGQQSFLHITAGGESWSERCCSPAGADLGEPPGIWCPENEGFRDNGACRAAVPVRRLRRPPRELPKRAAAKLTRNAGRGDLPMERDRSSASSE